MKLVTIMSSLLAGGLVLGSAFADRGTPPPPPPPAPAPAPHAAPKPPKPPKAPKAPKNGSVHIQIDGLDRMVDEQIRGALDMIRNDKNMPPALRAKITKRLSALQGKIRTHIGNGSNLDPDDLEELGDEIEREMEAFGREMEEYGRDMEEWGEKFGKDMEKKFGNVDVRVNVGDDDDDHDHDDVDDIADMPDDEDMDDLDDAVRDMGKLNLKPQQREQIKRLRAESDAKVATAKRELDRASEQLKKQLETANASDADIARSIDTITQQEATIRKARILAWVNARRVLDDGQRQKVEGAARKGRRP